MSTNVSINESFRTIHRHRAFNQAIEAASNAMSVWTQRRVCVSLDEICEVPLEEVGGAIVTSQDAAMIVSLGVVGDFGGQFLFTLDDVGASKLAALLLDRPPRPVADWGEIERSALLETGNILGSAYLSTLTNVTGVRLFPTPPEMLRDYVGCVIEQAIMLQALRSDTVLMARTRFTHCDQSVNWNLLFVPSPELLELLLNIASSPPASAGGRK